MICDGQADKHTDGQTDGQTWENNVSPPEEGRDIITTHYI